MIDAPQITQTAAQLTAFVHLTVPRAEIRNVMWPGLMEVRAGYHCAGYRCRGAVVHSPSEDGAGDL